MKETISTLALATNMDANATKKLLVISGIGVREYYRNLGYKNDGVYVSKNLG